MEQVHRLFSTGLCGDTAKMDEGNRFRLDDWELRDDIQSECRALWPRVTTENLFELTDYAAYKAEFLKLFGFGVFKGFSVERNVFGTVAFYILTILIVQGGVKQGIEKWSTRLMPALFVLFGLLFVS